MYFKINCFVFNVTSTPEIYTYCHTLSLHDALPIVHERLTLTSYFHQPLEYWVELALAADFADIFEVRGWQRESRGEFVAPRSEEHTSELQSLMRISYAVFGLKKNSQTNIRKAALQACAYLRHSDRLTQSRYY